jgi:hypothetical protein
LDAVTKAATAAEPAAKEVAAAKVATFADWSILTLASRLGCIAAPVE